MTSMITKNVIKISTTNRTPVATPVTKPEYPKTCDFCRDTYNSELTFNRHKETGKCFRFCRLLEEKSSRQSRPPKVSIYPRMCEGCAKVYKNKHSYYKHKGRCTRQFIRDDIEISVDETLPPSTDVDVVEVVKDDIENIPIADNKENIDEFSSKFILTLDVDKVYPETVSLYPRICEICHKVFKTQQSFESHKSNTRCSDSSPKLNPVSKPVRQSEPNSQFFSCENCGKNIHHKLLYNNHIKKCGKPVLTTVSVLRKAPEFAHCVESVKPQSTSDSPPAEEPSTDRDKSAEPQLTSDSPLAEESSAHYVESAEPLLTSYSPPTEESSAHYVESAEPQSSSDSPLAEDPSARPSGFPRRCAGCKVTFNSKSPFYRHHCPNRTVGIPVKKSIYPRTCEYCGFVFQTKFQFHRHKAKCAGYQDDLSGMDEDSYVSCDDCDIYFDSLLEYRQHMKYMHPDLKIVQIPAVRKHMYPRKCFKCFNVYSSRQTFCNHKQKCVLSIDTHIMGNIIDDSEMSADENGEKATYPRTCDYCHHTYSNRQSFCNHKKLCPDFVGITKDALLYPRRCEYCSKIYSSKQTYHHHKVRCMGFKNLLHKPLYPRACTKCKSTFDDKLSYHKHVLLCLKKDKFVSEGEREYSDENMDQSDLDCEPKPSGSKREKTYPRMCEFCRKIYANRHTFCKHKVRCQSTSFVDVNEYTPLLPVSEVVTYPRECGNCLGSFKNETTYNAHKIRCDFFETKVDEKEFKKYFKSNCEHCRNIVGQYRRIFHEHLQQCTDPIIMDLDPLLAVQQGSQSQSYEPVLRNDDGNFCECCGIFFKSREDIEQHIKSTRTADISLIECDICTETFDSKEELTDHKSRCILNVGNRTYPRFCECCKKIFKTKQTFYNHKKNCHVHCLKYFVLKDCENCKLPFKCENMYFEHIRKCVGFDDGAIAAECEVLTRPDEETIL